MSDNQTNQPAMASRHRRKTSLEVGVPATIRVHLTDHGKGLDDDASYEKWDNFWSELTSDKRWGAVTSYPFFLVTSTISEDKQGKEWKHPSVLLSPSPCDSPKEAEQKTKAAQEDLTGLGFKDVHVTEPDVTEPDVTEPDGKDVITMRWRYPDQDWVEKNMPGLEKTGLIKSYPVDVPGPEWIDYYFEWKKNGAKGTKAKRNSTTMLGTEAVYGSGEEREGKKAKLDV